MGGAPGAGSLLLNTKASQEDACSRAPAAIVPGPEPESRDAGVSRFAGNGSHPAEVNAAEGPAGWVGGPGSSGNTGIGSHLEAADATEGHAGQVDGPGSSGNAENGSHPAATDAAEGHAGHADGSGSSGNAGIGSHLEAADFNDESGRSCGGTPHCTVQNQVFCRTRRPRRTVRYRKRPCGVRELILAPGPHAAVAAAQVVVQNGRRAQAEAGGG